MLQIDATRRKFLATPLQFTTHMHTFFLTQLQLSKKSTCHKSKTEEGINAGYSYLKISQNFNSTYAPNSKALHAKYVEMNE